MGTCKWCGTSGLLVKVSDHGMCNRCDSTQLPLLEQGVEIIQDSLRQLESEKSNKGRIGRFQDIVRVSRELLPYEERGIPTCSPPPSELIPHFLEKRAELLTHQVSSEVGRIMSRAKSKPTPRSALTEAGKAMEKIQEIRDAYQVEYSGLDELEESVRRFLHETELKGYLTEAEKAESGGNKEKAIGQYQEALSLLANDTLEEELQVDQVKEIEEKIRALQSE